MDSRTHSISILSHQSTNGYVEALRLLFASQGIATTSPNTIRFLTPAHSIGDASFLFNGADAVIVVLCEKFGEQIYSVPGFRATLDRTLAVAPDRIFVVLTDDAWVPGFKREHVYIDLRQRGALAIVNDVLLRLKFAHDDCVFPPVDLPNIVHASSTAEEVQHYLLDLCRISERAGVMAFGAVLFHEESRDVDQMVSVSEIMQRIDLAAGPHLDVFGIRDSVRKRLPEGTALHRSDEPSVKEYSGFIADYFECGYMQVHYPSFVLFLIERSTITKAAVIPVIYLENGGLPTRLEKLFRAICTTIYVWRRYDKYLAPNLWEQLVASLNDAGFPLHQHSPPADTKEAILSFSNSVVYF